MIMKVKPASQSPQSTGNLFFGELEDRSAPRVQLAMPAKLRSTNAPAFNIILKDLSLSGFACEAITSMPQGARCWLTMPGMASMQAEVVWNDGIDIGCSFQNLLYQAVLDSLIARYSKPTEFNV